MADNSICRQVESALLGVCKKDQVINLTGKTTLRELVKSVKSSDFFLGMETTSLYIAIAADVPSIGIVGGGHYGRFIPWGDPDRHIFIPEKMDCFQCKWICPEKEFACIQGVTPAEVAQAVQELLARSQRSPL